MPTDGEDTRGHIAQLAGQCLCHLNTHPSSGHLPRLGEVALRLRPSKETHTFARHRPTGFHPFQPRSPGSALPRGCEGQMPGLGAGKHGAGSPLTPPARRHRRPQPRAPSRAALRGNQTRPGTGSKMQKRRTRTSASLVSAESAAPDGTSCWV